MLTIIKEDGTGRPDANTYASAADGDAYHEAHVDASAWTAATLAQKEAALAMATRLIDACWQFNGWKKTPTQALQWPRFGVPDPDRPAAAVPALEASAPGTFDPDSLPPALVQATCEQARALVIEDRTADPAGEGLRQMALTGVLSLMFDPADRRPILTTVVRRLLSRLGTPIPDKPATVRLHRA
jgi:hypothetical protein